MLVPIDMGTQKLTITLYSNTRTIQIGKFPEISRFLNRHHRSLGRHVNASSLKSLEIRFAQCRNLRLAQILASWTT